MCIYDMYYVCIIIYYVLCICFNIYFMFNTIARNCFACKDTAFLRNLLSQYFCIMHTLNGLKHIIAEKLT